MVIMAGVLSVNAQFRKIPAEVTDAFRTKYGNATAVSWKDKISGFQADFKVGEKQMKSVFSSKGEWLKTEMKEKYEGLPSDVKDGFKKSKYAEMSVTDITFIQEKEKQAQYKVTVKKGDFGKKSLTFSDKGQLLNDGALL